MWLLTTEVLNHMRAAARIPGREPTTEERREFLAAIKEREAPSAAGPRNLKVAGEVAQINIKGVLTEDPDCFAVMFGDGNTTYASIREALAVAESDPAVRAIVLNVNSPGGHVNGLFETLDAIASAKKPIRSRASLAASAAYALVSVAGPIEAVSEGSTFGSIGVAASIWLDEEVLDLASTEAPNKRPDVTTEEGKAVVVAELDAIHDLFVSKIAAGRAHATGDDFDAKRVNSDFGRGGVLLAKEAKKWGLIDAFPKAVARAPRGKNASADNGGGDNKETIPMDLATLKAQHPAVFAAAFEEGKAVGLTEGKAVGLTEGQATERKRVGAHLSMAEAAGDPKLATPFIQSGASVRDDDVFAAYQTASMKRNAQATRQSETEAASAAAAGATPPAAAGDKDLGDLFAEALPAKKSA